MASKLPRTRVEEIVIISSDEEEDVGPKRKTKSTPKKTARKKMKKQEAPLIPTTEIPAPSTQTIRCKYCGWKSEVAFGDRIFRCNSCGFEPSPMKKDVILNEQFSNNIGKVLNEEPVVISSDEDETDLRTIKDRNTYTNKNVKDFNELLRAKLDHQQFQHRKASVTRPAPILPSSRPSHTPPSNDSPAGLLASLYPSGPKTTTPSFSVSTTNSNYENLPKHILQSENEADNEQENETEPQNDVKDKEGGVPKDWESAVCVGFPSGWEWKRTNAWSRRVKFRSPEGNIFQARKGAVIHMVEMKTYTKEQIDQARHYEDQNSTDGQS